ncbi:hypothetical protein PRIPAC_90439, partial [Pristionchus pacificus]
IYRMGRDSSFASYEHEERWYRGATVIGAGISALALFTAAVVLPLLVAHLGTSTANLQEELDFCTSTSHNLWDQLEQLEDRTGHESSLRRQNYLVKKSTRASIVPEISSREKRSMRVRRQYGEAAAPATKESICIKGDPGPQGPPGYDGAPGKDGKAGHAGTPGADAEDGMVVCFDCYIGEPGPPGKPGPKGTSGKAGPGGAPGHHGKPGYKGAPGKRGPAGQDGYPGRPGKKGTDGVVEEVFFVQLIHFDLQMRTETHSNPLQVYMRPGPIGAPGPAGPRGDSGTPGLQGKDGAPGAPGAEGAPGRDGADGGRGAPGEPGANGPAGPTGGCGHCPPARLPPGY